MLLVFFKMQFLEMSLCRYIVSIEGFYLTVTIILTGDTTPTTTRQQIEKR